MKKKEITIDEELIRVQIQDSFLEYDPAGDKMGRRSLVRRIAGGGKRFLKNRRGKAIVERMMPSMETRRTQSQEIWNNNPLVSVVVPLYNTPSTFLRDMIESVLDQTYQNWELCMADGSDEKNTEVEKIAEEYCQKDTRVRYQKLEKNLGIAENTNACINMAEGSYIALFDHDDVLHPCALYECIKKLSLEKSQFVYTDEATFSGKRISNLVTCHRKPDYAPETLRSVNYICHLCVFDRELLEGTGLFETQYDGSQDHAMILKLTEAAERVSHVAKILYFWRVHSKSVSKDISAKSYAIEAGKKAVENAENAAGRPVKVFSSAICATQYRLEYEIEDEPKVTILLLCKNCSEEEIEEGMKCFEAHTSYQNYEILQVPKSEKIRRALTKAQGEYVVFVEAGMEPMVDQWLSYLMMYAMQPEVYAVGSKILGADQKLLQTGGKRNRKKGIIEDLYRGMPYSEIGYMGELFYVHNVEGLEYLGMVCKKSSLVENLIGVNSNRRPKEVNFITIQGRSAKSGAGRMVFQPYSVLKFRNP